MDAQSIGAGAGRQRTPAEDLHLMAEMVDQYLSLPTFQRGDIVQGVIVSLSPTEILVDIGGKTEGVVTSRDLDRLDAEFLRSLRVGDEVMAYVVRPEDVDGHVVLSLSRAMQAQDWIQAEKKRRTGETLEVPVLEANRGGLVVGFGQLRGFIPASQLGTSRRSKRRTGQGRELPWQDAVGTTIRAKVIEVDRSRNRLILSERAAEREQRRQEQEALLAELREGDRRRGIVRSICDFGVFVDLGGVDGLVHISELAWRRVDHPSEVVQEGQEIEVYVLGVDRERQRVALSMRRLEPEPWSLLEQMYQVGQVVEATITRLAEFGAFALLDSGVEGLIHISELAPHHVNHPREVVREGDVVQVRILRIEPERRRLALSLKEADEAYLEVDWDVLEPSESEEETNQREDAGGKAGGERPTTEEETGSEPTGEG